MSNLARGPSGDVISENTSNDVGLILDDHEFALLSRHRAIAIRAAARVPAISNDAVPDVPSSGHGSPPPIPIGRGSPSRCEGIPTSSHPTPTARAAGAAPRISAPS